MKLTTFGLLITGFIMGIFGAFALIFSIAEVIGGGTWIDLPVALTLLIVTCAVIGTFIQSYSEKIGAATNKVANFLLRDTVA